MPKRLILIVVVIWFGLIATGEASLHTFDPGTFAAGAPFTMAGPADFTVNYDRTIGTIDFYSIPANSTFSATVSGGNGVGNVTFTAERALVAPTQVSLLLFDPAHAYGFLEFIFPTSGLPSYPSAFPSVGPFSVPAVPVAIWRNSSLVDPQNTSNYLQGFRSGASITAAGVPEPSAALLVGGVVLIGCVRQLRQRFSGR